MRGVAGSSTSDGVPIELFEGDFDSSKGRLFTLLPPEGFSGGADYCALHDNEMTELRVVVFLDGAEYRLADGYHTFACGACAMVAAQEASASSGTPPNLVHHIAAQAAKFFVLWNDGETEDWFEFVRERDDMPNHSGLEVDIHLMDDHDESLLEDRLIH